MGTCPNCGEVVMEGDPYCSNCGTTFSWDDDEDEDEEYVPPKRSRAQDLKREAWELYEDGYDEEALDAINEAIRLQGYNPNFYNIKAIILEGMGNYNEALRYYDISLKKGYSRVVMDNKARTLERIARDKMYSGDLNHSLYCINEALKITGDDFDRKAFLKTKSEILERQGNIVDSKICTYLAAGMNDEVDLIEKQTKDITESKDAIICIAGTQFYERKLREGDIVDLIREPENEHDGDAIRVEKYGETVGYVANSSYNLIDGAKSASEIKFSIKADQKAKVMFLYLDTYLIARLVSY